MSGPLVRPPDDVLLARLVSRSRAQRRHHIDTCREAAWGAHNASRMAVRAGLSGDFAEARRHRERARWYLALARRHKDALT